MLPDTKVINDSEFFFRRTQEGLPSPWVLLFPVLFALAVVALIALFRRERRLVGLGVAVGVILVLAVPYLGLGLLFKDYFGWWLILTPVLVVALVYIMLMYKRDAQTIHPVLAAFLSLLRCAVYAILALVFLLPGFQNYNTFETQARVLVVFDVSDSMNHQDELPQPGQSAKKRPTRQDGVLKILKTAFADTPGGPKLDFLERLQAKSPYVAYRFGGELDPEGELFDGTRQWSLPEWRAFLHPDPKTIRAKKDMTAAEADKYIGGRKLLYERLLNATDLGGSALRVAQRESNNNIQAIIYISDGQNNKGSEEAYRQLVNWANNPRKPVQIWTVGVGEYRQATRIRLNPLRAPTTVRPDDDSFKVVVPLFGDGLPGETVTVSLYATRVADKDQNDLEFIKDDRGNVTKNKDLKSILIDAKQAKFSGGEFPSVEVDFDVNLPKILDIDPKKDPEGKLQGKWRFVARVPRHPSENFAEDVHVTEPGKIVQVIDRQLKVLIVAGGPSRDYQFARTMFYREAQQDRVNLTIYLQTAADDDVNQDVEAKYLLTQFPNKLESAKDKLSDPYNLKRYDVIIAFDVNWSILDARQIELLARWSTEEKGGLIFVAGDVNTDKLAEPGLDADKVKPLQGLLPVTLKTKSLEEAEQGGKAIQRTNPVKLHFKDMNDYPFINLDGDKAWEEFFNPKDPNEKRGFYVRQPISEKSLTAKIVAEFEKEGGTPYFAIATPAGKGKTFYIGSEDSWRLRLFKKDLHQKFWLKLAAYVSSGSETKKQGKIFMAEDYVTGQIKLEAEVRDPEGTLADKLLKPEVTLKRPDEFNKDIDPVTPEKFKLTAKEPDAATWAGIFTHTFEVRTPGVYTVQIKLPGTTDVLSHTFIVHPLNVEKGNPKTNFLSLYQMSTEARPVSDRLKGDERKKFEQMLKQSLLRIKNSNLKDEPQSMRLFVEEEQAKYIPEYLRKLPPERQSTKGVFKELWDEGWKPNPEEPVYLAAPLLLLIPVVLGGFMCLLLLISARWKALAVVGGVTLAATLILLAVIVFVWGLDGKLELYMAMSAYHVLLLVPAVVAAVAVLILLVIGRWIAAVVTVGITALIMGGLVIVNNAYSPEWAMLPLHMSWVLISVVGLLSLEWLMRKLMKLA